MLEDILRAREERWRNKCDLVDRFLLPVVSVTMNIPGPQKTKKIYLKGQDIILEVLLKKLKDNGLLVIHREERVTADGPEAILSVKGNQLELKRIAIEIEEFHPLGRLADIDVLCTDMTNISRTQLGIPQRKCIVCNEDARDCIISRRHTSEDILQKIENTLQQYINEGWKNNG